jgi:hypothetical protein
MVCCLALSSNGEMSPCANYERPRGVSSAPERRRNGAATFLGVTGRPIGAVGRLRQTACIGGMLRRGWRAVRQSSDLSQRLVLNAVLAPLRSLDSLRASPIHNCCNQALKPMIRTAKYDGNFRPHSQPARFVRARNLIGGVR